MMMNRQGIVWWAAGLLGLAACSTPPADLRAGGATCTPTSTSASGGGCRVDFGCSDGVPRAAACAGSDCTCLAADAVVMRFPMGDFCTLPAAPQVAAVANHCVAAWTAALGGAVPDAGGPDVMEDVATTRDVVVEADVPGPRWQRSGGGNAFYSYEGVWGVGATTYALLGNGTIERLGPTVEDHRSVTAVQPGGNGLWGMGSTFYAYGDGYVYRFTGTAGSRVGNIAGEVKALWGSGPNDLWAAMLTGGLRHWNGMSWENTDRIDLPFDANTDIRGLFGFGASDVWAVGTNSATFHWNGSRWERVPSGISGATLFDVWGTASNDVWAAGGGGGIGGFRTNGNILRNQGSRWVETVSGITRVFAIWGLSTEDIWAVGSEGLILHWNGSRWQNQSIGMDEDLHAVWARSPTDVWAVGSGGVIAHYGP